MKKIILVAVLFVMSTSVAFSQGWEWGAKAGVNLARQTKTSGENMRTGFYAGMFAERVISDYFGIQGELLYSQTGSKAKGSGVSLVYKANYLSLPILAKFYIVPRLSLDLGPQFSYLVSAKLEKENLYKNVKKFDASFAMGLSYKIGGRFDVSARYNLGLTKLAKNSDSKNGVISLGVGYRF